MNSAFPRHVALVSLTSILAVSIYCLGKAMSMPATTMVRMAMVNVFVEDRKTQTPIQDLNYTDFQIFDNGSLVEPVTFVSASPDTSSSIAMWILVSCPEQGQSQDGAGFVARNLNALRRALANLDSGSTVGVAHWCTDGGAGIDLLQTQDRNAPLAALEGILHQVPVELPKSSGSPGVQAALDLVVKDNQHSNGEVLPVIMVLGDGSLDLSREGADLIAKKLLYRGAILYQVKNLNEGTGREHSPFQTISRRTGGRVYSVGPENSLQAMNSIMSALHSRYTLGLILHNVESEWHEIRVRLTKAALQKHKSVRLDYSTGYLAAGEKPKKDEGFPGNNYAD